MITEAIGVVGGILFLVAFIQVANGKWDGKSYWYEGCNLVCALLLGWYAYQKHAYTNIVLNIIWGGVALYAINHAITRHKIRKQNRKTTKKNRKKTSSI